MPAASVLFCSAIRLPGRSTLFPYSTLFRSREALALLYRGCAERIAQQLQLPVAIDATEADWLRHAAALGDPARTRRAAAIVRTWQFAAYADRYPDQAAFEQLLDGWPLQPGVAASGGAA